MSEPSAIRLLIVDDHMVVREGLRAVLAGETDIEVVGEAADGNSAIARFRELRPDVTLLDLRLPDLDGIKVIGEFRRFDPHAKTIVLSTYGSPADVQAALTAGARGYLMKGVGRIELADAIRKVSRGSLAVPGELAEELAEEFTLQPLTSREIEILRLLGAGHTYDEIADAAKLSVNTVKTHVGNILTKLGVTNRTQAVMLAVKRGLIRLP